MKIDLTEKQLRLIHKIVQREAHVFSGADVLPSYKSQLSRLLNKLEEQMPASMLHGGT